MPYGKRGSLFERFASDCESWLSALVLPSRCRRGRGVSCPPMSTGARIAVRQTSGRPHAALRASAPCPRTKHNSHCGARRMFGRWQYAHAHGCSTRLESPGRRCNSHQSAIAMPWAARSRRSAHPFDGHTFAPTTLCAERNEGVVPGKPNLPRVPHFVLRAEARLRLALFAEKG